MSAPHFCVYLSRQVVALCAATLTCGLATAPSVAQSTPTQETVASTNESSSAIADFETRSATGPHRLESTHLPNLVWIHPRVLSGGLPEGAAAFNELVQLGVKTIITVDGAQPDVAVAKQFGLRYVHLPHGYDGIPENRVAELAKAVQVLDGPIYIHCHHGKHRSPAAASVACVSAGLIPAEQALAVLQVAGTSPNYRGLFRAAAQAKPIASETLHALEVEFHELSEIPPLAQAMVDLEHLHDQLVQTSTAGWLVPANQVDSDVAHQVLLLREQFTELLRSEPARQQCDEFRELLQDSEQAALVLESALRAWKPTPGKLPPAEFDMFGKRIADNCIACHVKYRDNLASAR